jgi:resuscitation-promoting factor RpfA
MGKHSAPSESHLGPTLAVIAMASAPALFGGGTAQAATANSSVLNAIASCESGGKNVRNSTGSSTASGYWQIVNGTWKAHGGLKFAPTAIQATYEEQLQVAQNILNGQGLGAWSESKHCWSKKVGVPAPVPAVVPVPNPPQTSPPKPLPPPVVKPAKPTAAPKHSTSAPKVIKKQTAPPTRSVAHVAAQSYLIKKGDTLSSIAKVNHSTVKRLAGLNRDTVKNVNLIYVGNHLRLR